MVRIEEDFSIQGRKLCFFADTLVCGKEGLVSPFLFYSYEFGLDETSHKGSYFNKVKY